MTRATPIQTGFRALVLACCFLACCQLLAISALGQTATATLGGTVEDENGALIPNAAVTAINTGTALQRDTTTDDRGNYVFVLLPPGTYIVRVQAQGFASVENSNVILNVGDQKSLRIQLKAGNISEMVKITGDAPLINESPAVGTVVDRQFVANLPLNGRSFNSLISLTPGVVQTKASGSGPGQFSVNGQRANANYFTVDGVSANVGIAAGGNQGQTLGGSLPALTAFGGTNNLVSVDGLQEFKVLTSSYAPEFGRTPGGQIQMVTRSGTNDFHGSIFNYLRNDIFDANDWFANRGRLKRPALRQNDFGGTIGGPVLFPRFGEGGRQPGYNGRNRTFFFFSYEGLRLRQPQVASNVELPSISLRQTALPQIQAYLNAFPIPNGADLGNGLALFSASYSNPATFNATSIRLDHTFGDRFSIFGRFNEAPSDAVSRSRSLSTSSSTANDTRTLTIGTTASLSSKVNNDFRFNYSKTRGRNFSFLDNFGGAVPVSDSQLFPAFASAADSQIVFGLGFSTRPELRVGRNADNSLSQINLVDTLSVLTGNHQLKFGVDYRRILSIYGPTAYFQQANFSNATAVRNAIATIFKLAILTSRPLFHNFSAFAQDTWKASNRITLTYGVRWEVNPPPTGADGNDAYTATGLDNPATITLAPRGTPLYNTTYNNFAPRFGIAYQLSQHSGRETVLRGGAGIFYDLGNGQSTVGFAGNPPFASAFTQLLNVPYPVTGSAANAPPIASTPPFTFVHAFDPNLKLPRTYQFNLAIEQSLGVNQTVSASYVAALGRKLNSLDRLVNPNATFTSVQIVRNEATSDYHAMQIQFQRRLSSGFQGLASYTWSKSIDEASSDFGIGLERGPSDFDVRHGFSAAVTYQIPVPDTGKIGNAILRNWSIDTIIRAQSATPVDLIARSNFNVAGQRVTVRPNLIQGIPLYLDDPNAPGGRRFNNTVPTAAQIASAGCLPAGAAKGPFCTPPTSEKGNLGRNALRGFPLVQTDVSLRRQINLSERFNLLLRGDVFNIFNHPNFGDPNNTLTSATFGESTTMFGRGLGTGGIAGGFSPLYQIGGARSLQFSVKIQF